MSRPRYRWWGFALRMIRDYPGLKAKMEDLHTQSITANMSGMPRGGGDGRTVETIALRTLPQDDQKAYDAVTRAIELTMLHETGEERIAMIQYLYWNRRSRGKYKIKDAAIKLHISVPTAKRWHGDFVRMVGKCYGFSIKDDTPEPKICDKIVP